MEKKKRNKNKLREYSTLVLRKTAQMQTSGVKIWNGVKPFNVCAERNFSTWCLIILKNIGCCAEFIPLVWSTLVVSTLHKTC